MQVCGWKGDVGEQSTGDYTTGYDEHLVLDSSRVDRLLLVATLSTDAPIAVGSMLELPFLGTSTVSGVRCGGAHPHTARRSHKTSFGRRERCVTLSNREAIRIPSCSARGVGTKARIRWPNQWGYLCYGIGGLAPADGTR